MVWAECNEGIVDCHTKNSTTPAPLDPGSYVEEEVDIDVHYVVLFIISVLDK